MQLVTPLMQALLVVLQRLHTAAAEAAQEATSSDSGSRPFNQLLSAVEGWNAALGGTAYEPDRWQHDVQGHLEQLRAQLQCAVPAAKGLAAALLEWWRRPAAQQVAALELAQAAAYRSCAYLRCANLGGEGGPAAGEGLGSLRCRCGAASRRAGRTGRAVACVLRCCCACFGCVLHWAPVCLTRFQSHLPMAAAPAARCGTAATPAPMPTGGRGTGGCARRWARRGRRRESGGSRQRRKLKLQGKRAVDVQWLAGLTHVLAVLACLLHVMCSLQAADAQHAV